MFSIKEVAENLQVSNQAIYKQKSELISKGYMVKNNSKQWEITENGFNYLRDKRINYIKQNNVTGLKLNKQQVESEEEIKTAESVEDTIYNKNKLELIFTIKELETRLKTVETQLEETKKDKEYFKVKYEEKDNLLNQYVNTHLLPMNEQEEKESRKRSFLDRLFNK